MDRKIVTLRVEAVCTPAAALLFLATLVGYGCGPAPEPGQQAAPLGAAHWPALRPLPAACEGQQMQALFAPDDPTVSLELSHIDRVRAARALVKTTSAEGTSTRWPWTATTPAAATWPSGCGCSSATASRA